MNITIPAERLSRLISQFAAASLEGRQVASRLRQLFPIRFSDLKKELGHQLGRSGASAERLAFTDTRYLDSIDELTEMNARARLARIEYETHVMLYKARQSLRRR